jgi:hypothetical protein
MMRRSTLAAAMLALFTSAMPICAVRAQGLLSLGVGGGVSTPQGAFSDNFETGWNALATLALGVPLVPVGLRLDGAYNRFGTRATTGALAGASERVISGTLNATLRLPIPASPVTPYIIAGGGRYSVGCTGSDQCSPVSDFGWNAGVGVRLSAVVLKAFGEIRYHHVSVAGGSVQYVPITVGLYF